MSILFVLICNFAIAQQKHQIIVNGTLLEDGNAFQALLNPNDIEEIKVLKGTDSAYLDSRTNDVISITLKSDVKVLAYAELLRKFKIKKRYRQYLAYVNNAPINGKANFFAPYKWIKEITVLHHFNGISEIPYLNIVANKQKTN